jgi:hypothetical protein
MLSAAPLSLLFASASACDLVREGVMSVPLPPHFFSLSPLVSTVMSGGGPAARLLRVGRRYGGVDRIHYENIILLEKRERSDSGAE